MSSSTQAILFDVNGRPIPQWYDNATDLFRAISTAYPLPAGGAASPIKDGISAALATVSQFHNADNQIPSGSAYGLLTGGVAQLYNGATMDRQRGNVDTPALIFHSASSAGAPCTDQLNVNGRGLQVVVSITAGTGTAPTLQVIIEGKDIASGVYYPIFTSTAIAAAASTTLLSIYPGLTGSATVGNQVLPRTWRVRTVIAGTTPVVTATVGASVIV